MLQSKALAILKSGKNVFLTGSAGTGKTYIINEYINYLRKKNITVAVTASTGIAATHINGQTIHSWSGMGIKNHLNDIELTALKSKKHLNKNLSEVKVLIIDEISMLHKKQFECVDKILRFFKQNNEPFGGIQVVLSGDFFQLPPVGNFDETNKDKFAFMSASWLEAKFTICYLTEQYRQNSNDLSSILNDIRNGNVTHNTVEKLYTAKNNNPKSDFEVTKLFTHNADVDLINSEELSKIKGKAKVFKAHTGGNSKLVESLKKSVLANEELKLKVGAKVMFVRNNYEKGYSNGTVGEVMGFGIDNIPEVKTFDDNYIFAEHEIWSIENEKGKVLAYFEQIPLRLAWAITVHKSQGMTLDAAEIDLSDAFEKGQGYVALSRLKNIENLRLKGFNPKALEVDGLAFKADARFKQLSEEADENFSENDLENLAKIFVKSCGGVDDTNNSKQRKKNTYDITAEFIKNKHSIAFIAKERGLSEQTVLNHIVKIKAANSDIDVKYLMPSQEVLQVVANAHSNIVYNNDKEHFTTDGSIKTSVIYNYLNEQVSYEQIKLALLFVSG